MFHPSLENIICQSRIHQGHLEISVSHMVDIHQLCFIERTEKQGLKEALSGDQLEKLLV